MPPRRRRLAGAACGPVEPLLVVDRAAQLARMSYRRYLRTPEWRQIRAAALLRAGNACALDASHTENLEVHHRTYERRGAELPTDLIVLCHACHQHHHQALDRPEPSLLGRLLGRRAA
jgi:5-methylcytosine-specific restriction endonuclease McrA